MRSKKVQVDVIALQETWHIKYSNLLSIPGYQNIFFKNRARGRGGGVGIYVRENLDVKIIEPPFASFTDKIFESITVQITDNTSSKCIQYYVSSVYRSPTPINNVVYSDQVNEFLEKLDNLFNYANDNKFNSFICLDSNINLLDLNDNQLPVTYLNNIINSGFMPVNFKASRMCNNSKTLIDQILTNVPFKCCDSGSIIDDLSDHWFTFARLNFSKNRPKLTARKRRLVNSANLERFRENLNNVNWDDALQCNVAFSIV
jgi:exonuclease III